MNVIEFLDLISPFIFLIAFILAFFNIVYYIRKIIYKDKEKTSILKKPLFWLIISLMILPAIYGLGYLYYNIKADICRKNINKVIENNGQIKTTVDNLVFDFITNIAKAEDFYKGKIVQITGVIDYIGIPKHNPPIVDNALIEFSAPNENYIICFFTNNIKVSELQHERENTLITIVGIFRKHEIKNYSRYIYLEYCDILE
jgi:amino acid transporter